MVPAFAGGSMGRTSRVSVEDALKVAGAEARPLHTGLTAAANSRARRNLGSRRGASMEASSGGALPIC